MGILGTCAVAALIVAPLAFTSHHAPDTAGASNLGGTIIGVVKTKETTHAPIRASIDPAICGQSVPDESVTVDAAGGLANVMVTVPGVKATQPAEASFSNEKCRFIPHVALMRPGGMVKMTSKDATLHTMHAAAADGKAFFNVSIPIPNFAISRPVDKAGVATLSCSTHTWMRAYLGVTEELTATSGLDGKFKLDGVPAGTYQLRVWHESLKIAAAPKVVVKDGETVTLELVLTK